MPPLCVRPKCPATFTASLVASSSVPLQTPLALTRATLGPGPLATFQTSRSSLRCSTSTVSVKYTSLSQVRPSRTLRSCTSQQITMGFRPQHPIRTSCSGDTPSVYLRRRCLPSPLWCALGCCCKKCRHPVQERLHLPQRTNGLTVPTPPLCTEAPSAGLETTIPPLSTERLSRSFRGMSSSSQTSGRRCVCWLLCG